MNAEFIIKALEQCSADSGNYIDMDKLCEFMRVNVNEGDITNQTLYGRLYYVPAEERNERLFIEVKKTLNEKERNSLCAMLLAKLMLNPEKVKEQGCEVDTFEFKGMREVRFSRMMYLATRLAIPESEIEKVDSNSLNKPDIEALEHYTEDLIFSAIRGHSVDFLLGSSGLGM